MMKRRKRSRRKNRTLGLLKASRRARASLRKKKMRMMTRTNSSKRTQTKGVTESIVMLKILTTVSLMASPRTQPRTAAAREVAYRSLNRILTSNSHIRATGSIIR